jgi:hypothetical protein
VQRAAWSAMIAAGGDRRWARASRSTEPKTSRGGVSAASA